MNQQFLLRGRGATIARRVLPLLAAGSLAACSSVNSLTSSVTDMFGSTSAAVTDSSTTGRAPPVDDLECPTVEIRPGAASLAVSAPSRDADINSLRYQLSFSRFARECAVQGGAMTMRVGVIGRAVLGPAGAPGQVTAPLRFAVVREGPEPRTIMTTFHQVPVTISEGDANVAFKMVAEDISFPLPGGDELDAYVVYVGFDSQPPRAPAKKKKR